MTWTDVTGPDAANCQTEFLVELARVELQQTGVPAPAIGNDHFLYVVAGDPPGGVLDCPLLVQCDFPVYTQICASGSFFVINPNGFYCPDLAVHEASWGAVKGLYR